jgi:hypothetical protein
MLDEGKVICMFFWFWFLFFCGFFRTKMGKEKREKINQGTMDKRLYKVTELNQIGESEKDEKNVGNGRECVGEE